jgi:hypothetical protein
MKVDAEMVHNWHVWEQRRRADHLPMKILPEISKAHDRHHRDGTSAQAEADEINRRFGLTDDEEG